MARVSIKVILTALLLCGYFLVGIVDGSTVQKQKLAKIKLQFGSDQQSSRQLPRMTSHVSSNDDELPKPHAVLSRQRPRRINYGSSDDDDELLPQAPKNKQAEPSSEDPEVPSIEDFFQEPNVPEIDSFVNYTVAFEKAYEDPEEESVREKEFHSTAKVVKKRTRRFKKGKSSYFLSVNQFADWTMDELDLTGGAGLPEHAPVPQNATDGAEASGQLGGGNQTDCADTSFNPPSSEGVASFSWLDKGLNLVVKDQSKCRSCWAFTTASALEAQLFKQIGQTMKLSQQQLVDCMGKTCGDGEWPWQALEYLLQTQGIMADNSYPFRGAQREADACKKRFKANNVVASVVGYKQGGKLEDDQTIMDAVVNYGPVIASIQANCDGARSAFRFYGGGILDDPKCTGEPDHTVLIVGFGEANGVPYWLIQNSWGTRWGNKGYALVARGKPHHKMMYPLVPTIAMPEDRPKGALKSCLAQVVDPNALPPTAVMVTVLI